MLARLTILALFYEAATTNRWYCSNCGISWSMDSLAAIEEEERQAVLDQQRADDRESEAEAGWHPFHVHPVRQS